MKKYFALPDYQSIMRGFVKRDDENVSAEEQVIVLCITSSKFTSILEFITNSSPTLMRLKDSFNGNREVCGP